ncbi:MAG: chemotaxis protein CheC [Bacteroidaceae bacterium]|nr:chemotaxis protein CheC [Bacteroidaceae bacterium]
MIWILGVNIYTGNYKSMISTLFFKCIIKPIL